MKPSIDWLEPWRNLPRTMTFYAICGVVGAIVVTALSVAFPPKKLSKNSLNQIEIEGNAISGPAVICLGEKCEWPKSAP